MVAAVVLVTVATIVALGFVALIAAHDGIAALHTRVRRLEEARELVTWPDTGRTEDR